MKLKQRQGLQWTILGAISVGIWLAAVAVATRVSARAPQSPHHVYVAFGFHGNLYHSFRNDTNDEVILMSYNNGLVSAMNQQELTDAVRWAISNPWHSGVRDLFGSYSPIVRPQEMMTTPGDFSIYRQLGIQAVALYYSATPFDAFRVFSRPLTRAEAHNPILYKNPQTGEEMVVIPSYHIGDLVEHVSLMPYVHYGRQKVRIPKLRLDPVVAADKRSAGERLSGRFAALTAGGKRTGQAVYTVSLLDGRPYLLLRGEISYPAGERKDMIKAAEAFMKESPDVSISISGGGSGNGIKAIIDGTTDVADSSRFIKDKEVSMAVSNGVYPVPFAVAYDCIVPVVHPSNSVTNLTLDQLKGIYKGEIRNWKAVGGPDREIVVISRDTSSGTYEVWEHEVMKKERVYPGALLQASNGAVAQAVAKNKNAIGYIGLGYVNSSVKGLSANGIQGSSKTTLDGTYPISRPLYMFTNGWPKADIAKFINYVTHPDKGQKLVSKAGFVPLY